MKTLDEVNKGFECCENTDCGNCPYKILFNDDSHVPCDQFSKDEDALHYLKEYQEMLNNVENDPLEWEEIRIIGKKPIWVEYHGMNRWVIPEEYRHDVIGREYILVQDGGMLFRFQQHEVWEAYRKERK